MILALDGKGAYLECLGADLIDDRGARFAVGARSDVVRLVRSQPGKAFVLVAQGFAGVSTAPNLAEAVICGAVVQPSLEGRLVNEPIPLAR
jgi:hypothetical protein